MVGCSLEGMVPTGGGVSSPPGSRVPMGNPQTQILIQLLTNEEKKALIGLETGGDLGDITWEGGEAAGGCPRFCPREVERTNRVGPSASPQPPPTFLLTSFPGTESRASPALRDVSATKPGHGAPLAEGAGRLGA